MRDEVKEDKNVVSEHSVTLLTRYLLIILMPIGITLALTSHLTISLLFGIVYADFPNASFSFSILSVSYVLWGVTYSFHTSLRSLGETRFFWIVGVGVIIAEILLCWYLTLWLGLLGCALVRAGYILILFLTAWRKLNQRGVSPFRGINSTLLRVLPLSFLLGIVPLLLNPESLLAFGGIILLTAGLYFVILLVSKEFKPEDFELAGHMIPERFHDTLQKIERTIWRN